jgi:NAD(P)H dehydrogenase (quinone)
MRTLIIYSHPNPNSFNHAVLDCLTEGLKETGQEYEVVDLYKIEFDPVLKMHDLAQFREGKIPADVAEQQDKVSKADVIIFVHPIWWGWMPAMLKGYLDRVFTVDFAYRMGKTQPEGLLIDKKVIFIRTTALPEEAYKKSGVEDLIRNLLTFKFIIVCGVEDLEHHVFYEVPSVLDVVRKKYLEEVRELSKNLFALPK